MSSFYNIARDKGGKDDNSIERGLIDKLSELKGGSEIEVVIDRYAPWKGQDSVDIRSDGVYFLERNDHTFSPVVIKAAVRVLYKLGFRGYFNIGLSGNVVTFRALQVANKKRNIKERFQSHYATSLDYEDDILLWRKALANPVPLFKTNKHDRLIAIFDDEGFYFSSDAEEIYKKVKSKPHIYTARSESGNYLYFGISNQRGGRWKRAPFYHLGTLAHEILGTKRRDDQNHKHWVEAWFDMEGFKQFQKNSMYQIRMKRLVVISFYVPEFPASEAHLKKAESRLIAFAKSRGLKVLNLK
jgi:hypothetical protein